MSFDWDAAEDDVRPFFGETPEPLGENLEPHTPKPVDSRTPAEWRELRIADGMCGFSNCAGQLDKDFYCATCGQVSLPRPVETVLEDQPEYLPTIPGALWPVDEYAPADAA